ncbi:hypothetical protein F4859DRAFT_492387 [Xylaria cf. heliscus]|nr:hypothetical protein F4859DRAFT_492387 [Xylaria cf. heliscus]
MAPPSVHEHGGQEVTPYFPRSGSKHSSNLLLQQLPPPPKEVGPIFDPEHAKEPLPAFDQTAHEQYYDGPSVSGEALPPPTPVGFRDKYLVPTLTRYERLRLTLLWYHTRGIEKDDRLRAEIAALVHNLQKITGWKYAIAGILNESTYRRLAAVNLPLAVLPRRESICSHTINQQRLDNVFMVLDMSKDWRFRHSPHSENEGLRSYAGTPLRLMTDVGIEIPLGSLCVASDIPQKPLKKAQRESLVSFSELISTAIASHTRQRRLKKRQDMADALLVLSSKSDAEDYKESAIHVIQNAYPDAHVSLQIAIDGRVPVKGRSAVTLSDVEGGLWEDTALIDQTIMDSNFDELKPAQTVRAIIARCGSSEKYVVVSGLDIHHVFDDIDAWFIFKAAATIAETLQSQLLEEALAAKETFLRGITHQLRTPIHGVLSSTDLLAEELSAQGLLSQNDSSAAYVSPAACINTIRNSGQELMRTVNSILKYNTWTDTTRCKYNNVYDLSHLEADILPEILSRILEDHLHGISVEFRNELSQSRHIMTDPDLLKDCLQEILLNAVRSVAERPSGSVTFTMHNDENEASLIFDIVDNGVGIQEKDWNFIFQPFYKVDSFKLGAGLGLTIAKQIASSLQGTVELVSSSPGVSSHFRAEFSNPIFDTSHDDEATVDIPLQHLPRTYNQKVSGTNYTHFVGHMARYLELNKFQKETSSDVGLVITDSETEELRAAYPSSVIIAFGETKTGDENRRGPGIYAFSGPLHTQTLKKILLRADTLYWELADETAHRKSAKVELPVNGINGIGAPPTTQIATLSILDGPRSQPAGGDQPIKALLVDDNRINLRILKMYCCKRNIPFAVAEDGKIAVKEFVKRAEAKDPFTLVLMDLQMPRCDGLEATRAIRAYERANALGGKSSIFMMTGQDWGEDKAAAHDAGVDVFLIKPASPKVLDEHIAKFFTTRWSVGGWLQEHSAGGVI